MHDFTFVTGNKHKLEYLEKWLGRAVQHQDVDLEELQSLDLEKVVRHKARAAYEIVQKPVLVEDVSLTFHALGQLPGTFVKWFLHEIKPAGLCQLVDGYDDHTATARLAFCYYDGKEFHLFEGQTKGTVAATPQSTGDSGWNTTLSWNSVFIPDGASKTYAQMTDDEMKPYSHRAKAIAKLKDFLDAASA